MPSNPSPPHGDARARLSLACSRHPISLIRAGGDDSRLIYVRGDLSAWGDECSASRADELTEEEVVLARDGLEHPDPSDEEFLAETSHFRHVPGFLAWLGGGPHPASAIQGRAYGLRRGRATPELSAQRAVLGGREAMIPQAAFELLARDAGARARAVQDPARAERAWAAELAGAWREAEFPDPIEFAGGALPAIPARTPILARRRRDGSWLFEHPEAEAWLCAMPGEGRRAERESLFHNGKPPVAIEE